MDIKCCRGGRGGREERREGEEGGRGGRRGEVKEEEMEEEWEGKEVVQHNAQLASLQVCPQHSHAA